MNIEVQALSTGRNVFILGAQRSGTTKLAELLRQVFGYSGGAEGHSFRYLARTIEDRQQIVRTIPPGAYDFHAAGYDAIEREMTLAIYRLVRSRFNGQNWVDKTPYADMVTAAPLLARHIPNNCFIFIHRNGLHAVASSQAKWPSLFFEDSCRRWADTVEAFLSVRDQLPSLLTISMEQMVSDPTGFTRSVAGFLGENVPPDEAILDFFKSPSGSSLATPGVDMRGLSQMGWTAEQAETFRQICGAGMEALGYVIPNAAPRSGYLASALERFRFAARFTAKSW